MIRNARTAVPPAAGRQVPGSPLRRAVALVAVSLTFGLVQLDATIVNVALQTLRQDLGGSVGAAQWVVDGYAVPFAACMLAAGACGDRYGHRRSCVAGFVVFGLASAPAALAGAAGGWPLLITARVLQGVGAAIMLPPSLAMIGTLYPERRSRSRALGVWGGVATSGFAAGPVLGGVLITAFGWPAIFVINLPVVAIVATVIAVLGPPDVRRRRRFDPAGTGLGMIGLGALTGAVIEVGQARSVLAAALFGVAAVCGVLFVRLERHSSHPTIPAGLVRPPAFRWALVTGLVFNFAMYGALLCVSLTLQAAYGFSALSGGLAVLPMALVVSAGATGSGFLAARLGPRRPMLIGFGCAAAGTVVLAAGAWRSSPGLIITGLTVVGLCSLAMPAMTSVALDVAPAEHAGLAGGALNTARQLGGAVGVAVLGAVLNAGGFRVGCAVALLLATAVCLLGLLSTVRATAPVTAR